MINIKAQQALVKFNKTDAGTLRYLMRPEKYSNLTEAKVIAEASVRSGIQRYDKGQSPGTSRKTIIRGKE